MARRISTSRLLTLASPEYLARHGRPQTPADLAGHQCLGYTGTACATWPYRIDGEMQWVPVQGSGCRPTAAMPWWMPASVAWVSSVSPASSPRRPSVPGSWRCCWWISRAPSWAFMRYSRNRYLPTRVRALADYLAERIGPSPYWDAGLP